MQSQADPVRVAVVERQLNELRPQAPEPLLPVLDQILRSLGEIRQDGASDRVQLRLFNGPGGTWKISRFALHQLPWIGLEWPTDADQALVKGLVSAMRFIGVPEMSERQFWIHFGSERN